MASKPRFGLDLDGVVFPWDRAAREALNAEFPELGLCEAPSRYWNHLQEQLEPKHWKWLWTEGIGPMFNRPDLHYSGAPSLMRWLAENTHLVVITHRPLDAAVPTMKWLAEYRVRPREVHIMETGENKTTGPAKSCDFYADDKVENVLDMLASDAEAVFMPKRYWNDNLRGMNYDNVFVPQFVEYDDPKEVREWLERHGV